MRKITRERYTLYNGDCRIGLKKLKSNSIDCIITDPPYFIEYMGDDWDRKKLTKSISAKNIIGGLPTHMPFDIEQGKKLQKFMEPICEEFMRVLKPGGFCIVFSQARLYHRMAIAVENAGFEIRDMLGWKYDGQPKAFSLDHIIKSNKDINKKQKLKLIKKLEGWKTPQLKPQIEPMVLAQKPRDGTILNNWLKNKTGLINVRQSLDGKFPGNIMEVSKRVRLEERTNKIKHPTVKPVKLISHLVRLFSRKNQVILDPFMGSGSHCIAALKNERKFIGFEIEKQYYKIVKQRLKDEDIA